MIDEAYDRAYREGSRELNAALSSLFDRLAHRIRPSRPLKTGETPCTSDPSPPSPSPRCR